MIDWDAVKTWTVLVVEDERDNADVIAGMMQYYGASVTQADNGQAGLEALQGFTPTLILLDLAMPTMDGWEMLKALRTDPDKQHIPVIALTAHAMSGDKERALAAGFDGYLSKPISVRSLLNDLRATVEQTAQQRAMDSQTPAPGQNPNQFLPLADQPDQPAKPAQVQEQKKS